MRDVASPAGAIAVVVLNWMGEHDTAACLDSLLAQRDVTLDILLIDNASPDGSGERLRARYPGVSYLQTGENRGYAGGNNLGVAWARARGAGWVLVVNNDTVLDPDCVRHLHEAAKGDERIAALAPLIVRFDAPDRVWFAGGRYDRMRALGCHLHYGELAASVLRAIATADEGPAFHECSFLTGCCLLLRTSALDEVGDFRADFFAYLEDVDLSLRLARAGWRLGWVPAARLEHRVPADGAPPSPLQIRLRDRNRRRLVREWASLPERLAFALWMWPTRLVHLARYTLRGDVARASAIVAGMRER